MAFINPNRKIEIPAYLLDERKALVRQSDKAGREYIKAIKENSPEKKIARLASKREAAYAAVIEINRQIDAIKNR